MYRLARQFRRELGGQVLRVTSPQGRFAAGADRIDGRPLSTTEAHGKQMFLGFGPDGDRSPDRWLRVHLGLYGVWTFGDLPDGGAPPEPRGAVRVRLVGERRYADLRGATACEVVDLAEKAAVHARLGDDPLRRDHDPARFAARVTRSTAPIGTLLMNQAVVAGVGNVYRAEVLFRAGLSPFAPGRSLAPSLVSALWQDLTVLLRDGVRRGRIVTTHVADRPRGPVRLQDAHYVYRRAGLPCRRCGTPVAMREVAGRRLYWCTVCQT